MKAMLCVAAQCVPLKEDDDKGEAREKAFKGLDEGGTHAQTVAFAKRTQKRLVLLVKLSFGLWTNDVCEQLRVTTLAAAFDPDETDDDSNVHATARAIGKTNTIIWQLVPPLVLVAKFAEVGRSFMLWSSAWDL